MRTLTRLVPLALFAVAAGAGMVQQACNGTVPDGTGLQEFPVSGVIRGNVVYNGPPPCTQNGQVVGNAIVFIFDRRNPPPPSGTATTAVNFGVVSGDTLFSDIPRTQGATKVCPAAGAPNVFASAQYTIAPMSAGSYVVQGFYDYTGNFLPTFDFRKLPEATDVGGGYVDLSDANKVVPEIPSTAQVLADGGLVFPTEPQSNNPSYQPVYLPVDVGFQTTAAPKASLRGVGTYSLPSDGYIADNVTVFLGTQLPFSRPYFYPEGLAPGSTQNFNNVGVAADGTVTTSLFATVPNGPNSIVSNGKSTTPPPGPVKTPANPSGTLDYVPVLSYPQDLAVYALPSTAAAAAIPYFQASFPQLKMHFFGDGADTSSAAEQAPAISPTDPFHMQLTPALNGNGGIYVFHDQTDTATEAEDTIPEGLVPTLWPLVVLLKLKDDPNHTLDPQSMIVQGSDGLEPLVIVQAITISGVAAPAVPATPTSPATPAILGDSLLDTVELQPGNLPNASNLQDHVTVLLRPAALCLDPNHTDLGGTVVTPFQSGPFPPKDTFDHGATGTIFNPNIISNPQLSSLVNQSGQGAYYGCLPTGRYQINVVYPTSQAWTTPNEIGGCAASEGSTLATADPGSCSIKSRPVLRSQGTRAVVEITPAAVPGNCTGAAINAFQSDGKTPIANGPTWLNAPGVSSVVPAVPTQCTTLPPGG